MFKNIIQSLSLITLLISFPNYVKAENLSEIVNLAFSNNYDYKSKIETFNSDYAYKGLANTYLLPKIDVGFDLGLSKSSRTYKKSPDKDYDLDPIEGRKLSITLVQPIYNPSAWSYYNQGKLYAERARIVLDKEKNDLILRVAEAYFGVLSAMDDVEYSEAKMQYLKEYLNQTEQKAKVGQGKKIDIEEVRSKYEMAKFESLSFKNNLTIRVDSLNKLVNQEINPDYLKKVKDSLSSLILEKKDMNSWVERSKQLNLDLLVSRISIMLADEDIKIASSGYYPAISLVGNYAINSTKDSQLDDNYTDNSASLGVSLSMNLYGGGESQVKRKQAKYKKESLEYGIKELENSLENISKQYYLNIDNGLLQIEALRQSQTSSEKFLESAKQAASVGLKTTTDVLIATETYFNAKREYSKSKYNYLFSILALRAISGVISEEDILLINRALE